MATENSAVQPVDRLELDGYDWFERHAEILACQAAVDPQIVLVGDSITHFWGALPPQPLPHPANGPRAYTSVFGGRRVLNAGFGWDRTQNVLWRLAHGELDGCSPSLAVVHIGTNNTSETDNARANTAPEIAEGVAAVCATLRAKLGRQCQLLVMKIFPREHSPDDPRRVLIDAANVLLPGALARAGITDNVELLDLRPTMLDADGTLPQALAGDFCHPNEAGAQPRRSACAAHFICSCAVLVVFFMHARKSAGYEHWAAALRPFVDALPRAVSARRATTHAAGWVIADMDGTLVQKPGRDAEGKYSANGLEASPVTAPLLRWLEHGGRLLCVTSDDGNWPVRKVWSKIPIGFRRHTGQAAANAANGTPLPPQVVLSTSDGAALFHGDADGRLVANEEYRCVGGTAPAGVTEHGESSSSSMATLDPALQPAVLELAREMFLAFLLELARDYDKLEALGRHRQDYVELFKRLAPSSATRGFSLEDCEHDWFEDALREAVTLESMMYPGGGGGGLKRSGTVIWRNQAGPTETWVRTGGRAEPTGDAAADFLSLCDPSCLAPYTNLFILGMPSTHSPPFIDAFAERLDALGLSASAAPNSVCIKVASIDKSAPLKWLMYDDSDEARSYGFNPGGDGGLYLAFGDNPGGNDGPLALFDSATGGDGRIPFVSVAAHLEEVPTALRRLHVGGEEAGCAAVIDEMALQLLDSCSTSDSTSASGGDNPKDDGNDVVGLIVQRAREKLRLRMLRQQHDEDEREGANKAAKPNVTGAANNRL